MKASLNKLKKGEHVRLAYYDKGNVYIKGDYDRERKGYWLQNTEDMNSEIFRKASHEVWYGFTY